MPGRPPRSRTTRAARPTFALLDVGNRWDLNGSSYAPTVLTGLTQDEVAAALTSPTSPLAQALIGSANEISAAICDTDGQAPASVCDSKGVVAADQALKITPPDARLSPANSSPGNSGWRHPHARSATFSTPLIVLNGSRHGSLPGVLRLTAPRGAGQLAELLGG